MTKSQYLEAAFKTRYPSLTHWHEPDYDEEKDLLHVAFSVCGALYSFTHDDFSDGVDHYTFRCTTHADEPSITFPFEPE